MQTRNFYFQFSLIDHKLFLSEGFDIFSIYGAKYLTWIFIELGTKDITI